MPDGEITAVKFAEIMKVLRGHKLSPFVRNYLLTVRVHLNEDSALDLQVLQECSQQWYMCTV